MVVTRLLTPLGPMMTAAVEEGICLLEFGDRRMLEHQLKRLMFYKQCDVVLGENDHVSHLDDELRRYFDGSLQEFTVPITSPGTDFQQPFLQRVEVGMLPLSGLQGLLGQSVQ